MSSWYTKIVDMIARSGYKPKHGKWAVKLTFEGILYQERPLALVGLLRSLFTDNHFAQKIVQLWVIVDIHNLYIETKNGKHET